MDLYNNCVSCDFKKYNRKEFVLGKGSASKHCYQHEWRGLEAEMAIQDCNFKLYAAFLPQRPVPNLPINGTELNPTKKWRSLRLLQ